MVRHSEVCCRSSHVVAEGRDGVMVIVNLQRHERSREDGEVPYGGWGKAEGVVRSEGVRRRARPEPCFRRFIVSLGVVSGRGRRRRGKKNFSKSKTRSSVFFFRFVGERLSELHIEFIEVTIKPLSNKRCQKNSKQSHHRSFSGRT